MREAEVNGRLVQAAPTSPDEATCPTCGGTVHRRKRRTMGGGVTYFYRHEAGEGEDCPPQSTPAGRRR